MMVIHYLNRVEMGVGAGPEAWAWRSGRLFSDVWGQGSLWDCCSYFGPRCWGGSPLFSSSNRELWWTQRGWCPLVLQHIVDLTVLLPECGGLPLGLDGSVYSDLQELCLADWRILGDLSAGEAVRERLLPPCVHLIHHICRIYTTPSGGPFVAGVLGGRRIHFTLPSEQCWAIFCIFCIWTLSTSLFLAISLLLVLARTKSMKFQWDVIHWWLSGCLMTDLKIHLNDLSFLHGICQWFWQCLLKSHLSICLMLCPRTWC